MQQEAAPADFAPRRTGRIGAWQALAACLLGAAAAIHPAHLYYDDSRANYIGDGWAAAKRDPKMQAADQAALARSALLQRRVFLGVVLAVWGAGVGAFLGVFGAAASGNPVRIVGGCLLGAAVLAAFGFGAGFAGMAATEVVQVHRIDADLVQMSKSLLYHGVIFSILGLGAGLVHALLFAPGRGVVVGMIVGAAGGIVGSLIYTPLISVVMPVVDTTSVVPRGELARLLWFQVAALSIGSALAFASQSRSPKADPLA